MKRTAIISFAVLSLLIALIVLTYPVISNLFHDKYHSLVQAEYVQEINELDDFEILALRQAAKIYNERLAPIRYDRATVAEASVSYNDILNQHASGLMGYIMIPKIGVNLPIYHGTSEEVLQEGVGHLIGSSLPIGGKGCHAVLTGHSGVAGNRLFSDLDQLVTGDIFFLHILGDTLAYKVVEIYTVQPYETDLLLAVPDQDFCTLVTCTPYGVNTHRLLVRGSRVPYAETEEVSEIPKEPSRSTWKEKYLQSLAIGGSASLGIALIGIYLFALNKKRKRRHRNEN